MDPEQLAAARRLLSTFEDTALAGVRSRAEQVTSAPSPEVGSWLRLLARLAAVRHAVEFGAAGGLTAAWLIEGMGDKGVLTSVEQDTHLHGLAAAGVSDAGIGDRVRSILGDPTQIAGRLRDDQYDLVLLQGDPAGHVGLLAHCERLLRPGGLLVARRVMAVPTSINAIVKSVAGAPWTDATMLPLDEGLLVARLA